MIFCPRHGVPHGTPPKAALPCIRRRYRPVHIALNLGNVPLYEFEKAGMQFVFADHVLDTDRRELRRSSKPIAVEPQVLDLLMYLLRNHDRVVSKDDLIAEVWGGRIVSDATLTSRIYAARKAIGDSGQGQRLIRTVARKGLRFVGDVELRTNGNEVERAFDPAPEMFGGASRTPLSLPERPAVAVLPFVNMSGDPEQEHFSDGISEDIITALSRLRWFFVIARNSTFVYKGRATDVRQIGEELGVGYVLEGSVRKGGERMRVTAQLNEVATGSHIWAERYDRDLADVFAVQDEITAAIVGAIEPRLYAAENVRTLRKLPDSMDAWELVMRALSHYGRVTRQGNDAARSLLEKAIEVDPDYAKALGLLAANHVFGVRQGWLDPETSIPIAEHAALAAVQADSEDPWAHHALGSLYMYTRRFDDSLAQFELALSLNPNFSLAHGRHGLALAFCGRWEEALEATGRALRLSPRDPFAAMYHGAAGLAQYIGGNYEEAMRVARVATRLRGDFAGAHRPLVAATAMAGHAEAAAAALYELRRLQPNISLAWIEKEIPLKQDIDLMHYLEGFRRAGLE
jgi:TolB-like protein/Tfp pilus assembly protein PilF